MSKLLDVLAWAIVGVVALISLAFIVTALVVIPFVIISIAIFVAVICVIAWAFDRIEQITGR